MGLQHGLPETMQVAVFIYGYRLASACAYFSFRLVFEIDPDASVFIFHIYECDVMFRKHRMRDASDLDLDPAVIDAGYYRYMLLVACIHCVRDEFLHLFSAAHDRDLGINHLDDDVAAMAAFVEFHSHDNMFYMLMSVVTAIIRLKAVYL